MVTVDADDFYSSAGELGYHYTGPFRTLSSLKRRLDQASALVSTYTYADAEPGLMVHPTMLDVAFQALLLALSTPGDQAVWGLHVPTSIGCIRVNPELCASLPTSGTQLPICTTLHHPETTSICGSVDIFSEDGQHTLMQAEDLTMKPFSPATVEDDRQLFTYTKWDFAMPNGSFIVGDDRPSLEEIELATLCERLSYYYLRKWNSEITEDEWANSDSHHQRLREYLNHTLSVIASGQHPYVKEEWSNDTVSDIENILRRHELTDDAQNCLR
jgi:hybrid polyketide synthase/nonribosomal peptide synthetase ACE1